MSLVFGHDFAKRSMIAATTNAAVSYVIAR
jgi:hypothetical protein